MALYTLVILVRNIVEAIRAVPPTGGRAPPTAMGYRPLARFVAVELPLALPGIVAGLRLATVSTVSLISVGALIGRGGLGRLFADGRDAADRRSSCGPGSIAVVVLALVLDALIVLRRAAGDAVDAGAGRRAASCSRPSAPWASA